MKELFKYQKKNIKCRQHFTSKMTNRLEGVAKLEELNVLELKVFEYYLLIKWKNNQLQIFGTSVILWGKKYEFGLTWLLRGQYYEGISWLYRRYYAHEQHQSRI